MSESGAMAALTIPKVEPWIRSPQSRVQIIEATWDRLEARLLDDGMLPTRVDSMRQAYVAGVYAAAAAVLNERAHSRELSEAAGRVERDMRPA